MASTSMNDFFIEKILGRGSFGSVYLVRRKQDQKIYALKTVIFEKLNKRDQENSLNEVRILASINHPNVIGYKEAFWDDSGSSLNIVMEYADDGDLETKIVKMRKEGGMFNESLIWSYSIQMIEGLKALHDKKIMHRDIKSANIFLVKDKHQCKIGDMNVSKVIKEKVLRTQTGTPYYASPEVWRDEPYSYKSDLWSIGCVIYELCALRPPFKGKDLDELYVNVCKGNIERISHIYSEDLWKMIVMLLQVDVKKRVDCKEFLDSNLIMKKIKEMKENNSECKDLEKNKNSFSGTLLKTIKFKDYKDIKSQLPTKKNYDINFNDINYNSVKDNINKNEIFYNNNYLNKNIGNNNKKNYNDNLIEQLTNNINNNISNLNNNIINSNNNINNYYYINYAPNYNQCFPTKVNNNLNGKKREEIRMTENYIFKTDINEKNKSLLDKIDLNSIRNNKKKLIQKNEILENINYINKNEDDIKKKKISERLEKKIILQKQRQKEKEREKERYTQSNQKINEDKIDKSASKKKVNNLYYNKIKNIENYRNIKKRPASSSRIIPSSRQKKNNNNNNNNNYSSSINDKKVSKISNKVININNNNIKEKNKKSGLCIQIFDTERNVKKKEISNYHQRAKTPIGNNNRKLKNNKRIYKSQSKLKPISKSSANNNNINSLAYFNCMTSPEEEKPITLNDKYDKIKPKPRKIDNEFWERKNVKITKNNNLKKSNSHTHCYNERALSATPNKRNPRLNPNLYENNNQSNHYKKIMKNYDSYINKDSYAYKITKKKNYRYLHESESNQLTRPITSIGNNEYNKNSNNHKKKNFIKKDIHNNNDIKRNICSKLNYQSLRKINSTRPNSCKVKGHENNIYLERKKNIRRYNPDITEPELLMMVNPIKIKDTYKNSQKNSLNITVNNNIVNQNIFLHNIKSSNPNINTNGNYIDNKEKNKGQNNSNNKYNHLQLFKDIYMNNDKNTDEPIKVINIFGS